MADSFKELTILCNSNRDVDTTNKVGLLILVTLGISIFNLILLIVQAIEMNSLAAYLKGKPIKETASDGKVKMICKSSAEPTLRDREHAVSIS